MTNKKDNIDPIENLEYEKVIEEEIINSYESKFQIDSGNDKQKIKFYRLKRTPLEIINRLFLFCFLGSFLFLQYFLSFKTITSIYFLAFVNLKCNN